MEVGNCFRGFELQSPENCLRFFIKGTVIIVIYNNIVGKELYDQDTSSRKDSITFI